MNPGGKLVSCSLLQAGSSHFLSEDYPISSIQDSSHTSTPPKINIEPENDGLEDDFPLNLLNVMFQVNLPGCIQLFSKHSWITMWQDVVKQHTKNAGKGF